MVNHKYIDPDACTEVIGCVYQDISLLDNQKYSFTEEDFPNEFHRVLFGALYELHRIGVKEFDISSIEDFLENKTKSYGIYKNANGTEFLQTIREVINPSTFDFYYQRMKKMTLLRMYNERAGMDLSWLYDVDNITDLRKKEKQEDRFNKLSIYELGQLINGKIEKVKNKFLSDVQSSVMMAGEGIDDTLDMLRQSPAYGVPLYGNLFNTVYQGARLTKFYLRSGSSGSGKALPNSTKIPTPNGYRTVGEIKPGDYLFDAFGNKTKVLEIYPQGKKEVWEISFKDGRKALCSKDHLWSYWTNGQKQKAIDNRDFHMSTTEELYDKGVIGHRTFNFKVPQTYAVHYDTKQLPIHPYVLGLMLGDGSFRYSESQKAFMYSSEDEILPNCIAKIMGWNVKKTSDKNYSYMFEWKDDKQGHKNVWVKEILQEYPELWQTTSYTKFIPKEYLLGDITQRQQLLNGLLDTDGSVSSDGRGKIRYFTISPQLRDDVYELATSLGYIVTIHEDIHKKDTLCYVLQITGRPIDKNKLFILPRKRKLVQEWFDSPKRKERNEWNPISEIKPLNYEEEMTCFYVDNPEHLFLMNDYIVTHNTRRFVADACTLAATELYDPNLKTWVSGNVQTSVGYITTEQGYDEMQTMMLSFISCVNEDKILDNSWTPEEYERIKYAAQVLKKSKIYIKVLPDFTLQDIEDTIRYFKSEYDISYVIHDYIHSSLKILGEVSGKAGVKGLREDNVLFMISVKLKDLANELGIFILSGTQINNEYHYTKTVDESVLSGAKSIAFKVDIGEVDVPVTEEDRGLIKTIVDKLGCDMPDIKCSIYKNRRGKWTRIYIWCKKDLGVCRVYPLFCTNWYYELLDIGGTQIKVK